MKSIGTLANRLYVGYAFLVFFLPTLLVFPLHALLSVLPRKKRLPWMYRIQRVWVGTWELLTGIWFRVDGLEHIHPDQTYVMVANHTNMLDIPLVGSRIIHPWVSLVKKELLAIPMVGYIIGMISIPVDRTSNESRQRSMLGMVNSLRQGISLLVFPEGTRNTTRQPVKRFYPGAFGAAIQAQVPVLPIVITHTRRLQPPGTIQLFPGRGQMHILPPIPTTGLHDKDTDALCQQVQHMIEAEILRRDPAFRKEVTAG